MPFIKEQYPTVTTKITEHKRGVPRLADGKPVNGPVKTYNLSPEELKEYLKTHELPHPKRGRGRPKKMKIGEIKQPDSKVELEHKAEIEKYVDELEKLNLKDELHKLEQEVAELSKGNIELQNLLDDLQAKYNQLALDYETAEQVRYDLTRAEGQRDQLKVSLKETEEVLTEETNKREALERLVRLYV